MRERGDRLITISAGFIGIAALLISAYQAYIMREQQRASVWPRVELLITNSSEAFSLSMSNAGIGPALVQLAEVSVDGKPQHGWSDVQVALGAGPGGFSQSKIGDRVVTPGQAQEIWSPKNGDAIAAVNGAGARVEVSLCYCSIYDECWRVTRTLQGGARLIHAEARACRLDEARRFDH
jgi:hypothetical protein